MEIAQETRREAAQGAEAAGRAAADRAREGAARSESEGGGGGLRETASAAAWGVKEGVEGALTYDSKTGGVEEGARD